MIQPPVQKPILTIDLKIRFQSRVYRVSLTQILRWLVPLIVVVVRVVSYTRHNSS